MKSQKRYFIPIIGTISAGKSTFLNAFLGINVLQTDELTTTKFICLIKNSINSKFYHVIPKREKEKEIYFEKEGQETKGEENIKKRIEEINNKNLTNKKINKNDIFYILETPLKNIENSHLLKKCYFMDIPGLNENQNIYIDIIFSLININDIMFEIIVFDSTSIGSDNILNIFKKLEKKKCLKKSKNIFILNKIDQCSNIGDDNIIDKFREYFYQTFEDEKDKDKDKILINIYKNYFVPMNSLSYLAESKINEHFCYYLFFELFNYLENNKQCESFFEFIQLKIEHIIENGNLKIDNDLNMENKDFNIIINRSIEYLKEMIPNIKTDSDFYLGLDLNDKNIVKEMKKLYLIYKNKKNIIIHSKFYNKLKKIIKNKNIEDDSHNITNKILVQKNATNIDISTIEELENFINKTFKIIDPKNELDMFKIALQSLRENILVRKLRIAFIGNINTGKSTILNSIIGEDILPVKETECTYRGIIIRHINNPQFKLYKTQLKNKGEGFDKYYYFEIDSEPYCKGKDNIKSFLKNKNNDKKIEDNDAFFVITGKLKIFDDMKLENNLIDMIEFIDLPGKDRKENTFNRKDYYRKILKFSNCCIYVNEPKSIDDSDNIKNMMIQYAMDKEKVFPSLRHNFINTCIFLINKSDKINDESNKNRIKNNLYNNMKNIEKELDINNMNISFFSGQSVN